MSLQRDTYFVAILTEPGAVVVIVINADSALFKTTTTTLCYLLPSPEFDPPDSFAKLIFDLRRIW
jgi:hypothetical protein